MDHFFGAATIVGLMLASALPVGAQEPACEAFTWNLARERELLAQPGISIDAAASAVDSARVIELDRPYLVRLIDRSSALFSATPGKATTVAESTAGVLRLRTVAAGRYRVALSSNHWVDLVQNGRLVPSSGFQGRAGCPSPHKVVEFELPAEAELVLQLSAGTAREVTVLVSSVARADRTFPAS